MTRTIVSEDRSAGSTFVRTKSLSQTGISPSSFASTKERSKLLLLVEDIKQGVQAADTNQNRTYVLAIGLRKLLKHASDQFAAEERCGYVQVSRFPVRLSRRAKKLREQHESLLNSLRQILQSTESLLSQANVGKQGLQMVSRLWSLCKQLSQHEHEELKLIDEVASSMS